MDSRLLKDTRHPDDSYCPVLESNSSSKPRSSPTSMLRASSRPCKTRQPLNALLHTRETGMTGITTHIGLYHIAYAGDDGMSLSPIIGFRAIFSAKVAAAPEKKWV